MQAQSSHSNSAAAFDADAYLATLTDAERRRLTAAVKIISEWLLSRNTKSHPAKPK